MYKHLFHITLHNLEGKYLSDASPIIICPCDWLSGGPSDLKMVWMGTQYSSAALAIPCFCLKLYNFFHTETLQQSIILPSTAWNRLLAIHQMRRQPNLTKPTWKNIYPALFKRNNELICRFLVIQKIHKKIVPEIRCLPLLLSYLSSFYKLRKGSLLRNTLQGKGKTFALKKSFALFWQNLFF